jgi:hypothetical protein
MTREKSDTPVASYDQLKLAETAVAHYSLTRPAYLIYRRLLCHSQS